MNDAPSTDLSRLLAALRGARDPWSRLKLMATGARALAKLTPGQRVQLLRQLGLEGAEELAEAAVGGDPQTTAAMTQALRALEADPQRVRQLASAIADPASRRATLMGLGAHVIDAVTAPPPPAPGSRPPPAAAVSPSATGAAPTSEPLAASGQPATPPPSPQPPKTPQAPRPATPPAPAATPRPPRQATPEPPRPPASPEPLAAAPDPAGPVAPSPSPAGAWHARSAEAAATSAAVAASQVAALAVRAPVSTAGAASTTALGALRAFRRQLAAGEAPPADAVAALFVTALPHDWARRRALGALFARRLPAAVDEALELVGRVEGAGARRWALADLAASRPWSDADWDRLLAAADSAAARRRLVTRRQRA